MARIYGYCLGCRKFKQVRVSSKALADKIPMGYCSECEEE